VTKRQKSEEHSEANGYKQNQGEERKEESPKKKLEEKQRPSKAVGVLGEFVGKSFSEFREGRITGEKERGIRQKTS